MFKVDFRARTLVAQLAEARHPVPHGEGVEADCYRQVAAMGADAIPALIQKVSDTGPTGCATCARWTLGDVCLKVLLDMTDLDLRDLLDPDVRDAYDREGAAAYFRRAQSLPDRLALQARLEDWWSRSERTLRFNPQRLRFERA